MTREVHAILILFTIGAVTLATRILPVLIFGRKEHIPSYILYLGKTVPYTAMGLLIVYCLKDVNVAQKPYGLPELLALSVVTGTYLWKRHTIFSVLIGTIAYMVLVQMVF